MPREYSAGGPFRKSANLPEKGAARFGFGLIPGIIAGCGLIRFGVLTIDLGLMLLAGKTCLAPTVASWIV
jgi:hypothetical protein